MERIQFVLFISMLASFTYAKSQNAEEVENGNSGWVDLRTGFVGDLKGEGMEFPALSLGIGGNYNTKQLLYTLRLNYNKEIIMMADAPKNTPLWDLGVLVGKYFEGGSNGYRKFTISGGVGMIWGKDYVAAGIYSYREEKINAFGFIVEAKIFRVKKHLGLGFAAIANINPEIHYFGGAIYIPIISF